MIASGAVAERIHVAPSGVDLQAFADIADFNPKKLQDKPRLNYIGRISRDRGLGIFESLARCQRYRVSLIGPTDEVPAADAELYPAVPYKEVPHWYGRTDIVLLPYQTELDHAASISPLKLFEAMAAGRPVIASDLPSIREVIHMVRMVY